MYRVARAVSFCVDCMIVCDIGDCRFFLKPKPAYESRISDWSSDVCSSDLRPQLSGALERQEPPELRVRDQGSRRDAARDRRKRDARGDRDLDAQRRDRPRPEPDHPAGAGIRSEEHTSELQSLMRISYAVFCLKKKKT